MANEFISRMLITSNVSVVKDFYNAVFEWNLAKPASPRDWVTVDTGVGPGGIIMKQAHGAEPLAWLPCVKVVDIDATITTVLAKNGKKVLGKQPLPDGSGFYAIIADPLGAKIAIQAAE